MTSENEQTLGQLSLAERLASVQSGISDALVKSGRTGADITTIVVTKFHPAALVEELYDLGVRDVGENRHQEASAKAAELARLTDLNWHFVGQLQSKKARQVRQYASVVHSVDRPALVTALDAAGEGVPPLPCFVQVNLTEDAARGGVEPAALEPLVEQVLEARSLELLGVMAVAPLGEDPREAFARLRSYSERVVALQPAASRISAGMSHDYREALLEGATHLRIGTAITGIRPTHG
ncbi:YggS family pyridoxal phosphate-dependent enzyme [Mycetocola zhujimingii]|uniref:Pyridoxal phosphate homeostasis protein n=1 Tax=Mycetocola zhujimingii TaxID=2079792 RepID=A0A2U1TG57_9MICO|nr:YggS family pyridoxal phosphate-dependent enzyme [Mycetocola zhujimingii]AWB86294.1 YggS family pyridoxal phosphate-dependent enzyme [Mycetocola zhujimingii]PWC07846.1 YggS family pyridoxal phosphate-dependent enzyme [Mycetocola zhujimingii]